MTELEKTKQTLLIQIEVVSISIREVDKALEIIRSEMEILEALKNRIIKTLK